MVSSQALQKFASPMVPDGSQYGVSAGTSIVSYQGFDIETFIVIAAHTKACLSTAEQRYLRERTMQMKDCSVLRLQLVFDLEQLCSLHILECFPVSLCIDVWICCSEPMTFGYEWRRGSQKERMLCHRHEADLHQSYPFDQECSLAGI